MLNMADEFTVKFRGVRGSYNICTGQSLKYGGNTSCIEVKVNGHTIIIDAGSGIIDLGNELISLDNDKVPAQLLILFSHAHYDHVSGLPFFKPIFNGKSNLYLFGPDTDTKHFKDIITTFINSPYFPVNFDELPSKIDVNSINSLETIILNSHSSIPEIHQSNSHNLSENTVLITCLKSMNHPKDGVLIYKISYKNRSMVFASDIEGSAGGNTELINFAKDTDILIHDAQYIYNDYYCLTNSKQGYGHSTPEMAAEVAKLAGVKKLVLFHMDPSYNVDVIDSMEKNTKELFENTIVARESLEISLI